MNLIFYIWRKSVTFKPRQDKTRHDKAWQGKARRGQKRQDEAAPRQEGVPWFWKILYITRVANGLLIQCIRFMLCNKLIHLVSHYDGFVRHPIEINQLGSTGLHDTGWFAAMLTTLQTSKLLIGQYVMEETPIMSFHAKWPWEDTLSYYSGLITILPWYDRTRLCIQPVNNKGLALYGLRTDNLMPKGQPMGCFTRVHRGNMTLRYRECIV